MADIRETRTCAAPFEFREQSGAPVLEGYATTFNDPYDMGPFREVIDPGAFTRTLSNGADVRLLVDHDGQPLARTKSGTLQLAPDATGLQVRATLDPSDPDVQRLLPKMRRGDLDQMSFAFRVPSGGDEWGEDFTLRTIREANLSGGDVSVVTYPANPNTAVSVRARNLLEARCVFIERMVTEIRAGQPITSDNRDRLMQVLQMISVADDQVDEAQEALADLLGVPNPDMESDAEEAAGEGTEMMQANSGRPFELSRRIAVALSL